MNKTEIVETRLSNILINVHKDGSKKMRWKRGSNYPKSVVISDFQIFETDEIFGSAGWAPPEQWLGQFISRSVFLLTTKQKFHQGKRYLILYK